MVRPGRLSPRRSPALGEVGEAAVLARLRQMLRPAAPGVVLGPGDDAAVLAPVGPLAVWTVDTLVEDVDFRRRWASWSDIGHKAAAVNLSDLAAMGAQPRGLLLSLAAGSGDSTDAILALARAVDRAGRAHGAPLVGGDLSGTAGPLTVTVSALGQQQHGGLLRRQGGRPGDIIAVTGPLGGAAAGLALLEANVPGGATLKRMQRRPRPHLAEGRVLARLAPSGAVTACIDLSDGLARDARQLAAPPHGLALDLARLPLAAGLARRVGLAQARRLALTGGEDLVLAVALSPRGFAHVQQALANMGGCLTAVGRVLEQPGLWLQRGAGVLRPVAVTAADGFGHWQVDG